MRETSLQPIVYSLQFRGRITSVSSRVLEQHASAPSQALITTLDANGLAGHVQPGEGEEALLVSRLVLADDGSFDQSGTIEFAPGHLLAFRSVGAARLGRSPDPHLRHGAAVWEVEGGEGQFRGAQGRITSNFFVSDTNELTDNHFGLIFVARAASTCAPLRRVAIREKWSQFRRSSAFKDLLAECALWTTPWTGFPPYQDHDCAEEFALGATVWSDFPYYGRPDDTRALPSSISARRQPRRQEERM
jgi:hypothetical protein